MVIQFTMLELMYFFAGVLGITAGIFLLSILWNIKKMVAAVRPLVETNQETIYRTIRTMPGIFEDVEQISSDIREITSKVKISLPMILHEVEGVAFASKANIELAGVVMENVSSGITGTMAAYNKDVPDIIGYFHIFEEVLQILYRTFYSKK
jgi:hypothetical protein